MPKLAIAPRLVAVVLAAPAAETVPIRFTLGWTDHGVHPPFRLAKEKGSFDPEGLDVTIDQGEGSTVTATRIASGADDAVFGDIDVVIQQAASAERALPSLAE